MKHIKRLLLVQLISVFVFSAIQAQNYYIDFTASGTATTLDSVFVENLTQGTSITLQGNDTLHLYGTVGIISHNHNNDKLSIYPNPFNETSHLAFRSETTSMAGIDVYDIGGKHILHLRQEIQRGDNIFEISRFPTGHYQLIVKTETWQKSVAFVSLNTSSQNPQIQFKNTFPIEHHAKSTEKNIKNTMQMPYNNGDILLFKGVSGNYSRITTDVPTQSQTIDFEFIACIDLDGNHYPVVTIGNQTWMAKNLAYLPSVAGTIGTGSQTIPYYYVYGYYDTIVAVAKLTANYTTYGVLYNWTAAMAGSSSSSTNPSNVQGVCPAGWHLPSDAEWAQLANYLGSESVAGGKLKAIGTTLWVSPNTGATNETGFTGLPGGYRNDNGYFSGMGGNGNWWSSTEDNTTNAYFQYVYYLDGILNRDNINKAIAFSVRCIKD